MSLNEKIKTYLENNSKNYETEKYNYILRNDRQTPPINDDYLESWSVDGLDAPTQSEIDAL
jgi:hypothetical protein